MSEFFERKKIVRKPGNARNADINFYDVFKKYPPPLLTNKQQRYISQLFLHFTANRNAHRNPKKEWPILLLVEKVVKAFRAMMQTQEFRTHCIQVSSNSMTDGFSINQQIQNTLDRADRFIENEKVDVTQNLSQRVMTFSRSGTSEFLPAS